ncbi:unnamed protein product [Camellia sinensis]
MVVLGSDNYREGMKRWFHCRMQTRKHNKLESVKREIESMNKSHYMWLQQTETTEEHKKEKEREECIKQKLNYVHFF